MKKILCLILCLIGIVSCCSMTISAATENVQSEVLDELSKSIIDGKKFDEANYPKDETDKNMYIIAVVEQGFEAIDFSSNFNLFVYIYNPSCVPVVDSIDNGIYIGANADSENYKIYRLSKKDFTADCRFMKFKVAKRKYDIDVLYQTQQDANNRVYSFSTLYMKHDGIIDDFSVAKSFSFSGSNSNSSLISNGVSFETLNVELYDTNWISPNAGTRVDKQVSKIYDHYEINSVYFAIPNRYFVDGTLITSIRASFDAIHLTPIVIGKPSKFASGKGYETKQSIKEGRTVTVGSEPDIYDLVALKDLVLRNFDADWVYTENSNIRSFYANNSNAEIIERLAYYFDGNVFEKSFDMDNFDYRATAVSSEELESYFYSKYKDFELGTEDPNSGYLYTERVSQMIDYKYKLIPMIDYMESDQGMNMDWRRKLSLKEDSYVFTDFDYSDCYYFETVDPSVYIGYDSWDEERIVSVSNDLYISHVDVGEFSKFCEQAAKDNCRVVLLRFGFSDYTCAPIIDPLELEPGFAWKNPLGVVVDKWAFLDVSLAQITFQKNEEEIVVPICSNSVNSFGDVDVFPDPNRGMNLTDNGNAWRNLLTKLKDIFKIIGIILLIVVFLPVLWPVLKIVIQFFSSLLGGVSNRMKKRRAKKRNDQNKKE